MYKHIKYFCLVFLIASLYSCGGSGSSATSAPDKSKASTEVADAKANKQKKAKQQPKKKEKKEKQLKELDMDSDDVYKAYISSLSDADKKAIKGNEDLEYYLHKMGETNQVERIKSANASGTEQYWFSEWFSDAMYVKWQLVNHEKPDVIVIGGSRTNQFREGMFAPYSFYSMANTGSSFKSVLGFIEGLEKKPKVVIMGLEPFNFKESEIKVTRGDDWKTIETRVTRPSIYTKAKTLYKKKPESKDWAKDVEAGTKYIGIRAYRSQRGVRSSDGSVSYGSLQEMSVAEVQRQFDSKEKKSVRMLEAKGMFKGFGPTLSDAAFESWQTLVKRAKEMGVTVVGVTLPFSQPYQDILDGDPKKYAWWKEYQDPKTTERLRENGALFFNFSRFESIGADKLMMVDLMHPGEPAVTMCVEKMFADAGMKKALPKVNVNGYSKRAKDVASTNPIGEVFTEK